jgi:hypothetical protein
MASGLIGRRLGGGRKFRLHGDPAMSCGLSASTLGFECYGISAVISSL